MRLREILAIAGGVAAIAGVTAAVAAEKQHVMAVRLPDGQIEHVRYTGDVPPRILIADPVQDPFAGMDRIAAMMDAQTDAMMAQASEMQRVAMMPAAAAPAGQGQATVIDLPQGAGHFSYVSTTTVNGRTCTVSMQSQPGKQGAQPQMIRHVSGDGCSAVQRQAGPQPVAQPVPPTPPVAPRTVSQPVAPKAPLPPKTVAPDTI